MIRGLIGILQCSLTKLLGLAVVCVLFLEMFIRENVFVMGSWLFTHYHMFFLNVLVVLGIALFIQAIFNQWRGTTVLTMALAFVFGLINSLKYKTLGQYYYPWDNGLVGELGGVMKNVVNLNFTVPAIFFAIMVLLLIFMKKSSYWNSGANFSPAVRAASLCLSAVFLMGLVLHKEWRLTPYLDAAGVRNYAWDPVHSYKNNGSSLAYLINYRMNYVEKPKNYSKEQIAKLIDRVTAQYDQGLQAVDKDGVKPNVIVVMSEALWDPNQLERLSFSEDPMKWLNASRKSYFVSPTFGGYTCNVEFELLTGMTMKYLPPTSVPYQHFIKKEIPALPSELRDNGYSTVAIHPYHRNFWGRDKVYPLLGFDAFISEEGFPDAPKKGYYVSDDAVMDKVIETVETEEKPVFIFAVTMQNHGPYKDNRYKTTDLKIENEGIPLDEQMIATYCQGVKDADSAFKKLTDYVEGSKEPTLIIEFGDHLPSLGENFEMYRKYGYVRGDMTSYQDLSIDEQLKLRSTQVSSYSNTRALDLPAYVSPSLLSARILAYTGSEMNDFYRMLYTLNDSFSCIYGQKIIDNSGAMGQMEQASSDMYWEMQYDLLVGKQYAKDIGQTFGRSGGDQVVLK